MTAVFVLLLGLGALGTDVPSARAARVLVVERGGHVRAENDRFLAPEAALPGPSLAPAVGQTARVAAGPKGRRKRKPQVTVISRLAQFARQGQITAAQHQSYLGQFNTALRAERRLSGTRRSELSAITENLHAVAVSGALTAPRLPVLFLTLQRNVEWWTANGPPAADARVEFYGDPLVWEYYPGQGLELQVLATFGKADGMFTAGPSEYGALQTLLAQMIPLAVPRAGGIAWEYYFRFDGGSPPWVSAMAQGTALEALTRAYVATGSTAYLATAHAALPLFQQPPPAGVAQPAASGTRFLQYSFAPGADIINAFLQTLIGLYDYAQASSDPVAQQLFGAGNAQAQAELPGFDTGAWSLYQPGLEDTLSYHQLVTGFLQQLCTKTQAPVYCHTASDFQSDTTTPPSVAQLTARVTAGRPMALRFSLNKVSRVGLVVVNGAGSTVVATSAQFPHGVDAFTLPHLTRGSYSIRLAATDLAGNFNRISGTLTVNPRPGKRRS